MKYYISTADVKNKYGERITIGEYVDGYRVRLLDKNLPKVDFFIPHLLEATADGLLWPTDFQRCPEIADKLTIESADGPLYVEEKDVEFIFGHVREFDGRQTFMPSDAETASAALIKIRTAIKRYPWKTVSGVKAVQRCRGMYYLIATLADKNDTTLLSTVTRADLHSVDYRRRLAIQSYEQEREGRKAGLPRNVRIWSRHDRINAGGGWVILPNGMNRLPDYVEPFCLQTDPYHVGSKHDGWLVWRQIRPGELVLKWSHEFASKPHVFEVVCRPENITEAQLERAAELRRQIQDYWEGRRSAYNGKPDEATDGGWDLS